jgi:outer membrane lipoprotein-sorting protein
MTGCVVKKVTHVHVPGQGPPALDASFAELVNKVNTWSDNIHTLTATVDLQPTAGSVYSGVVKEYHDVKGFILMEKPATIRILGQAPVVRTNIFDMVSKGDDFRLYLPTKQKFVVGKNSTVHPAKNALENLRPQHILQSLIVPPIDGDHESAYREKLDTRSQRKRYYVINVIETQGGKQPILLRHVWFDRTDLEVSRVQFYAPDGTCTEDVEYSDYQDFKGIHYPTHIELNRPEDDYQVTIVIEKATFNEPIPAEKFELKKPEGAELVDLSAPKPEEHPSDQ